MCSDLHMLFVPYYGFSLHMVIELRGLLSQVGAVVGVKQRGLMSVAVPPCMGMIWFGGARKLAGCSDLCPLQRLRQDAQSCLPLPVMH